MKRFSLITPFLFTLAFLLNINYWIATMASPGQMVRLLVILWALLVLLIYPAYLIAGTWEMASVLLTIFVFGVYFSDTFFAVVGPMVLVGVVVWLVYFRVRRFGVTWNQFFLLSNGIAISIIAFSLYLNIRMFAEVPWRTYLTSVNQARHYSIEGLSAPAAKPDIYYIVLDGYPRSDILKEFYNYDNGNFTTYLRERGFVVPADVHSNYARTAVSIPSTLNMDYLESFAPGLENSHFWWQMVPFIEHSRVRAILESQGYKTSSLTTWSLTYSLETASHPHPFPIMLTEFERYVLGDTPLGYLQPAIKEIVSVPTVESHRRIIHHFFESLRNMPEASGPKFVFAHVTVPHPPFIFDRNGTPLDQSGGFNMHDGSEFSGSKIEYQNGYVEQVEYVNAQMQIVLDAILENTTTPPIIIIQADHGSGLWADFSSAERTCIKERFSPFAAYYLPGRDQNVIPAGLTSVNIFRIIFDQYFQTDLPLLENRQYYYKNRVYIYRTVDVTSRIDEECIIPQ